MLESGPAATLPQRAKQAVPMPDLFGFTLIRRCTEISPPPPPKSPMTTHPSILPRACVYLLPSYDPETTSWQLFIWYSMRGSIPAICWKKLFYDYLRNDFGEFRRNLHFVAPTMPSPPHCPYNIVFALCRIIYTRFYPHINLFFPCFCSVDILVFTFRFFRVVET